MPKKRMYTLIHNLEHIAYNIPNKPLEIIFLSNKHSLPIVNFKKVLDSELLYDHKVSY